MTNKKTRVTVYIDTELHNLLREAAFLCNENKSFIINEALKNFLILKVLPELVEVGKVSKHHFDHRITMLIGEASDPAS